MFRKPPAADIDEVRQHLLQFPAWFNAACERRGLDIRIDAQRDLASLDNTRALDLIEKCNAYKHYSVRQDQIAVAVDAIVRILEGTQGFNVVAGESGSGTLSTSLTLMFGCPIHFLRSGTRLAPLFLSANQHACLAIARGAMRSFLHLYGDLRIFPILPEGIHPAARDIYMSDPEEFSLWTYLVDVLGADWCPYSSSPIDAAIEAATAKRGHGDIVTDLTLHRKRAKGSGHELITILDHSLHPARTRGSVSVTRRPPPVARLMAEIAANSSASASGFAVASLPSYTSVPSRQTEVDDVS